MHRRGFLGKAFGVVAAVAGGAVVAAAVPSQPDAFSHKGYQVRWRDWMQPVNQNVVCGMWFAKHDSRDQEWVSTTLGQCYPSRAWEVVDMTREPDWPKLTAFSTDAERAAVKRRALDALLAVL